MKTKNIDYPDKLTCKICKKSFSHLGSHIYHAHKMLARDYKTKFGLPYSEALISETIYYKKVKAFNLHRNKYLANIVNNTQTRFIKGESRQGRRISELERKRFIARIDQVNQSAHFETCPVCNMQFKALASHLFNKHGLIIAKQIKS